MGHMAMSSIHPEAEGTQVPEVSTPTLSASSHNKHKITNTTALGTHKCYVPYRHLI